MTQPLSEKTLLKDPYQQFAAWYEEARPLVVGDPTQVALATADATGRPSARIVLLKGFDAEGFVFFTNYQSRKGADLAANPQASLLWWWSTSGRQVRAEGAVEKISTAESDAYFASRARGSQLGAWASEQSLPLADRAALEARVAEYDKRFGDEVPRPPHWGGYRLRPDHFEFWQNGENRLHDRFTFEPDNGGWKIERLNP